MEIQKQQEAPLAGVPAEGDLAEINRFAKTPLEAKEVYAFCVKLCDNEVDRELERFDEEALQELGDRFVGKSGMFDHRWSAQGQTARIYRTELVREPGRITAAGDGYCYLKGYAYLLRSEKNQDLIAEIEGGIKKEVSVGCSVKRRSCSICGAESGSCAHVPGERYGDRLCYTQLQEVADAYEWSFVAVPAQRDAGVMKRFRQEGGTQRTLLKEAALGKKYLQSLRQEVVRLAMLSDDALDGEVFSKAVAQLEEQELLDLCRVYQRSVERRFPVLPQLRSPAVEKGIGDEKEFLV